MKAELLVFLLAVQRVALMADLSVYLRVVKRVDK